MYIVLRPNLLSIYRDQSETKLRHQINLSELTAVARQKDQKRREKHIFGLFTPSRNYHLEAASDQEAQTWVDLIRREARIDEDEEEIYLASPGGATSAFQGFERGIDTTQAVERGGYSSSDAEIYTSSHPLPSARRRGNTNVSTFSARRPSQIDYSGVEHGSYSDFSDSAGPGAAARMSTLSLAFTDAGRPSTSSNAPLPPQQQHSIYGQMPAATGPPIGARNPSQISNLEGASRDTQPQNLSKPADDPERVVYHSWIYLLKSKSGVRQWKKVWMVLRPKALALYKSDEEYESMLILPFSTVINVVEIDPISKSKKSCMQVIGEERNYRFCAYDEESLARWLGAFKSLLSKRKAKELGAQTPVPPQVGGVQPPTPVPPPP